MQAICRLFRNHDACHDGCIFSDSLKASVASPCRFIPVYNIETDGAEHLRGGEHGVGDNRLEMAELGGALPSGAPVDSSTGQLGGTTSVGAHHSIPLN